MLNNLIVRLQRLHSILYRVKSQYDMNNSVLWKEWIKCFQMAFQATIKTDMHYAWIVPQWNNFSNSNLKIFSRLSLSMPCRRSSFERRWWAGFDVTPTIKSTSRNNDPNCEPNRADGLFGTILNLHYMHFHKKKTILLKEPLLFGH